MQIKIQKKKEKALGSNAMANSVGDADATHAAGTTVM